MDSLKVRESNASKLCFPFADFPLSRFSWFPRGHLYPCDCCRTYTHHLRPFSHLLISFFNLCRPSRLARPPILDDLRFESLPFVLPSSDRSQRNLPFTEPSLTIILDPQTFFWHLSSDFVLDPIPFVLALAFVFSFLAWLTTLVLFLAGSTAHSQRKPLLSDDPTEKIRTTTRSGRESRLGSRF